MTLPQPDELYRLREERAAIEAVNRQLYDDLLRLLDLQAAITAICAARTLDTLVAAALQGARRTTSAASARWYEPSSNPAVEGLRVTALTGETAPAITGAVPADGIPWQVIRRRRCVWCDDPANDRRYRRDADRLCGEQPTGSLTVPIAPATGPACALEAVHGRGQAFDDEAKERLETLAAVVALRLDAIRPTEQPAPADRPGTPECHGQRSLADSRAPRPRENGAGGAAHSE